MGGEIWSCRSRKEHSTLISYFPPNGGGEEERRRANMVNPYHYGNNGDGNNRATADNDVDHDDLELQRQKVQFLIQLRNIQRKLDEEFINEDDGRASVSAKRQTRLFATLSSIKGYHSLCCLAFCNMYSKPPSIFFCPMEPFASLTSILSSFGIHFLTS